MAKRDMGKNGLVQRISGLVSAESKAWVMEELAHCKKGEISGLNVGVILERCILSERKRRADAGEPDLTPIPPQSVPPQSVRKRRPKLITSGAA